VRSETLTEKSLANAAHMLARRDEHLAAILKQHGPPPLWRRPQGFSTLVKIILEQQVSLASAASIYNRLAAAIDPFGPLGFIEAGELYVRSLGVTRQKAAYLVRLAESIESQELRLRSVSRMTDGDAKVALMSIKGIGSWSADIYLLMAMRRADIWPTGDLALATSMMEVKQLGERPTELKLLELAEPWRPFRAVGARMLWQSYLARRNRKG
jgi:DNA-3-methyladenine glycosylase II